MVRQLDRAALSRVLGNILTNALKYSAGDYSVSGSYYPAITAGATGAEAFNEALQPLNARVATIKNPETGKVSPEWGPPPLR